MPALAKSRVGSPWGTSGPLGRRWWPRSPKKSRKDVRMSWLFMMNTGEL
jgi:hypothetical protein